MTGGGNSGAGGYSSIRERRVGILMRQARIERTTQETQIVLELALDGSGAAEVETGIGFLDHMLTLMAGHGLFDLKVQAQRRSSDRRTPHRRRRVYLPGTSHRPGVGRSPRHRAHVACLCADGRDVGPGSGRSRRPALLRFRRRVHDAQVRATQHRSSVSSVRKHRHPRADEFACGGSIRAQRSPQGRRAVQGAGAGSGWGHAAR